MFLTDTFWIANGLLAQSPQKKIEVFHALLSSDIGVEFKRKDNLTVRRIEKDSPIIQNSAYPLFLKRTIFKPTCSVWRVLARAVRRWEMPHSEAFHVHLAANALAAAGIQVMPILASGERRILGIWPKDSFVLVGSADGEDALLVFQHGTPIERKALMTSLGELMAKMHTSGYYYVIRLSDIFCSFKTIPTGLFASLTMIDLDFKGDPARPQKITKRRTIDNISLIAYIAVRCGLRLDEIMLRAWWRQYRKSISATERQGFLLQAHRGAMSKLSGHWESQSLRQVFVSSLTVQEFQLRHPRNKSREQPPY